MYRGATLDSVWSSDANGPAPGAPGFAYHAAAKARRQQQHKPDHVPEPTRVIRQNTTPSPFSASNSQILSYSRNDVNGLAGGTPPLAQSLSAPSLPSYNSVAPRNPLAANAGTGASMTANGLPNNGLPTPFTYAPLQGEFAGTFMDPGTGITYAAYTEPMPAPPAFIERPVNRLNEPSRLLEFMTGVSYLPPLLNPDLMHDARDTLDDITMPEAFYTDAARARQQSDTARDVFFERNEPLEPSFMDTFWDGYIGDTYVLRTVTDTQTLSDNSEFNHWTKTPVTSMTSVGLNEWEQGDGVGAHVGDKMQPTFTLGAPKPGKIGVQNVTEDSLFRDLPMPVLLGPGRHSQWHVDRVGAMDPSSQVDHTNGGALYLPGGGVGLGQQQPSIAASKMTFALDDANTSAPIGETYASVKNSVFFSAPAAGLLQSDDVHLTPAAAYADSASRRDTQMGVYKSTITLDDNMFGGMAPEPIVPTVTSVRDARVAHTNRTVDNVQENWMPQPHILTSVKDSRVPNTLIRLESIEENWTPQPVPQQTTTAKDARVAQHNYRTESDEATWTPARAQALPPRTVKDAQTAQARPVITLAADFGAPMMPMPVPSGVKLETFGQQHMKLTNEHADMSAHASGIVPPQISSARDSRIVGNMVHALSNADSVSTPAVPGTFTYKHMRDSMLGAHTTIADTGDWQARAPPTTGHMERGSVKGLDAPELGARASHMTMPEYEPRAAQAAHESRRFRDGALGAQARLVPDQTLDGALPTRNMPTFRDVGEVRDTDVSPDKRALIDAFYTSRHMAAQPSTYGLGARTRPFMQPITHDRPGLITAPLEYYRTLLDPNRKLTEAAAAELAAKRARAAAVPDPSMQTQAEAYESAYESGKE